MLRVLLLLHIAVFLAGFTGVFGRLISLDSYTLVLYRMVVALISFGLYMHFFHPLRRISRSLKVKSVLLGVILMTQLIFFYWSIKLSNVSIGVITISCMGFFTALIEPFIFKRKFSFAELFFSLIAIVGILFVFGFDGRYRLGITIGLIGAFLSAIFVVGNKFVATATDYYAVLFYQLAGGLVFLILALPIYIYICGTDNLTPNLKDWVYLFILGSVCTALMFLIEFYVVRKISAFTLALTTNLEPVYSIVLAMILFNEAQEVNFSFYLGLICIIMSVLLQSIRVYRLGNKSKKGDFNI